MAAHHRAFDAKNRPSCAFDWKKLEKRKKQHALFCGNTGASLDQPALQITRQQFYYFSKESQQNTSSLQLMGVASESNFRPYCR